MLQQFNFQDHTVRVVLDDDNQPMFVAKDVADILGYADTRKAINTHCKGEQKYHPLGTTIKQVNQALNATYTWQPLKKYCDEHNLELEYVFPNGYSSISVAVYPYNAWLDVYEVDLDLLFKEWL